MQLFSELYGVYYATVSKMLAAAVEAPLTQKQMRDIISENAFSESVLNILPSIREERWQLLRADGSTPIRNRPTLPLTMLERRWLKAISLDPRIRLFDADFSGLEEVEPLFAPEDILIYDCYADGDPFRDEGYIRRFGIILRALRERVPLSITMYRRDGREMSLRAMPERLEYSEKDDKFRLITSGCRYGTVINLARISRCTLCCEDTLTKNGLPPKSVCTLVLELVDRRNALERVLLHFAHFEKQAERLSGDRYRITVRYDRDDETELVIRVLSFGQFVRVTEPDRFVGLIRERLLLQKQRMKD